MDLRSGSPTYDGTAPDYTRPAKVFPRGDGRYKQYNRLTDARIAAHLGSLEADVVVGTRPGLNVHIARQARRGPVRVGQEHLTLDSHGYRLRREIGHRYALLDAVTTVTEADARSYRTRLKLPGVRIEAVPNSVPAPTVAPADADSKWVVAAGRLTKVKRYDLLVKAFSKVVAARPDWRLRIYGSGDATGNEKQRAAGADRRARAAQPRLPDGTGQSAGAGMGQGLARRGHLEPRVLRHDDRRGDALRPPGRLHRLPARPRARSSRTASTDGWCRSATRTPSPTRCSL